MTEQRKTEPANRGTADNKTRREGKRERGREGERERGRERHGQRWVASESL